jgi:hypothetical protein
MVAESEQDDRNTDVKACCMSDAAVSQLRRHAFWMEGDHHSMRSTQFLPFHSIGACVSMAKPKFWTECNYTFGGPHVGIAHSLMCDGSARAVSENVDIATWQHLGAMSDGGVIGDF